MDVVAPGEAPAKWDLYAGTPCWMELSTTDVEKACEFYAGLFGWEYDSHRHERTGEHVIAYREGFPVASLRSTSRERSTWRLYLATEDGPGAVRRAEDLGAQVQVPEHQVPDLGSKVVMVGPDDDEFGMLEPAETLRFDVGLPGTLMWAELVTIKAQTADSFFGELFGYGFEQFGADNRSDYAVWYVGDESVLARVSMIRDYITAESQPHWLLYLGVDATIGVDDFVHRAIGLGGRVRVDPYDSSIGRASVLRDPTGARFAVVDGTQAPGEFPSAANYDAYGD